MTRALRVVAPIAALVFGLACAAFIVLVLGALSIESSDGEPPPYLRLFGLVVYATALGAAAYDAATLDSRSFGFPFAFRLLVSVPLAGGAIYFIVFFAFAPWNITVLLFALPGLLALVWVWRVLLTRSAA